MLGQNHFAEPDRARHLLTFLHSIFFLDWPHTQGMRSCSLSLSCQEIVCKWRDEFPENPAKKSTDNGKRLQQYQEAAEEEEEEEELRS